MAHSLSILNVLGSVQRALLGNVTPNLRAVDVLIKDEKNLELIFYYDKEMSKNEEELPSLTETEVASDFPEPDYHVTGVVKVLSYPARVPQDGFLAYLRHEEKEHEEKELE